jgi:hypothetical protein
MHGNEGGIMKWFLCIMTILLVIGCDQNRVATDSHKDESDRGSLTKTFGWTNEAAGASNSTATNNPQTKQP